MVTAILGLVLIGSGINRLYPPKKLDSHTNSRQWQPITTYTNRSRNAFEGVPQRDRYDRSR